MSLIYLSDLSFQSNSKKALPPLALSLLLSACSASTTVSDREPSERAKNSAATIEEVVVSAEIKAQADRSQDLRRFTVASPEAFSKAISPPTAPPEFYRHPAQDRERYPDAEINPVKQVAGNPVSTFAIDVDTAAYANARRQINAGAWPRSESVRVEEFINYFNYNYPRPENDSAPFSITTEVGPSPWNSDRKLMLVGLQGYDIDRESLPAANLVFLIDVSGSMNNPTKLGLLKSSMKMLTKGLRPQDSISIAVYAGAAGEVLPPTSGNERAKIMQAIDALTAGGSTNGGAGIKLAYSLAQQNFNAEGINRVILATDGDFNVGTTSTDSLRQLIEEKRKTGVSLTVLGFGAGNYNDALMQELAQKGNGNAAYIDSLNEARKVLVDEVGSTLKTIAKDVKIQVEFNPDLVREYRLIGYETRALRREDFNNDKIDAGEIGAGHSVTALYELTLTDAKQPAVDDLRYSAGQKNTGPQNTRSGSKNGQKNDLKNELAQVKLRYKAPGSSKSKLLKRIITADDTRSTVAATSESFRFAAAASAFGELLRGGDYTGDFTFADAQILARQSRGADKFGYRSEFEQLLRTAAELAPLKQDSAGG